jgi:hypothetical protein
MSLEPKTISIDFDQTLCDSQYPGLGPPKWGAKHALMELKKMGFTIIISSCRSCSWNWDIYYGDTPHVPAVDRKVHQDMIAWLDEHEFPYDIVDDGTKGKVSASYMVDDKGVRYTGDWIQTLDFIKEQESKKEKA